MYALISQYQKERSPGFWTGEFTDYGKPSVNVNAKYAFKFPTARSAYDYAGPLDVLQYFRVVNLDGENPDGFKSFWWVK